jgi:hypothetical protein
MWEGYFRLGDTEVINNALSRAMAENADIPVSWFKGERYQTVQPAVAPDQLYDSTYRKRTPWYDANQDDASQNFFGVYCLGVTGLDDSTRTANLIEGIEDGGVIGPSRRATKQVKFSCILLARGREALEYGTQWLDAVLDAQSCGNHGATCGLTDLTYFTDVPPDQAQLSLDDYSALLLTKMRYLHDVGTISGPIVSERLESRGVHGVVLDFTIAAQRPYVYTATKAIDLQPAIPSVVQDIPYNLATYPSFELAGPQNVVVATNYATTPSAEAGQGSWLSSYAAISGTTDLSQRVTAAPTTELSASRGYSMRSRLLGSGLNGSGGRVELRLQQIVPISALQIPGTRVSFTVWMALFISGGFAGSNLVSMTMNVTWLDASGNYLGDDSTHFQGRVFSISSLTPPLTARQARVDCLYRADWTSSSDSTKNSDIRAYADALAVTVP